MRYKSFSLIEILVATVIFMVVIVMSISAFAMVKRSNERTNDLSKSAECSRQIENLVNSLFKSANYGENRIMRLTYSGGAYQLGKISNPDSDPDSGYSSVGFAIFEPSETSGKVNASIIFKKIEATSSGYFYKNGEIDDSKPKNGGPMGSFLNDAEPIQSSECKALMIDGSDIDFDGNYRNPFELTVTNPYKGGPSSQTQIGNSIYSLKLNDIIFSKYSTQNSEDKAFSRLYVEAINNIRPI